MGLDGCYAQLPPFKSVLPSFENRPEILLRSPYPLLKDQNVSISLTTDRPADSFSATGLPNGLSLDSLNGLITGAPTNVGNYESVIQATNQSGSLPNNITFQVNDFSGYPFGLNIALLATVEVQPFTIFHFFWN